MKALLVLDSDRLELILRYYLTPFGIETLRYRNPIKAIDNLDEVGASIVIMSARDYPRHWKPLLQILRQERNKDECVFVLLKGERFPFEEAAKAMHLGVNGVIRDDLEDPAELERFQQLLKRYISLEEGRRAKRILPTKSDRLSFLFTHPRSLLPVPGTVESLSASGLSFKPDYESMAEGLERGDRVDDCFLRVGDEILSLSCTLVRAGRIQAFAFEGLGEEERKTIEDYVETRPKRELASLLKRIE